MPLQNMINKSDPRHDPCAVPYSTLNFPEYTILLCDTGTFATKDHSCK